jgi:hypothetical protein
MIAFIHHLEIMLSSRPMKSKLHSFQIHLNKPLIVHFAGDEITEKSRSTCIIIITSCTVDDTTTVCCYVIIAAIDR